MRFVLTLAAVAAMAVPALAEDGNVSKATLSALGLDIQQMSDQEGLKVRGLSSQAEAYGQSTLFIGLTYSDVNGLNTAVVTDTNGGRGTDENAGGGNDSSAELLAHQGSGISATLQNTAQVRMGVATGGVSANAQAGGVRVIAGF